MQRDNFINNCYKYMKGKKHDIAFIWNFIQQNNIIWIESLELQKGIHVVDGELIMINLDSKHIYINSLEKINYV